MVKSLIDNQNLFMEKYVSFVHVLKENAYIKMLILKVIVLINALQ